MEQQWSLGNCQRNNYDGIYGRRIGSKPREGYYAFWLWNADGIEIAARLRELADMIEADEVELKSSKIEE